MTSSVQYFLIISADIYHGLLVTALARNVLKRFFSVLKLTKLRKMIELFNRTNQFFRDTSRKARRARTDCLLLVSICFLSYIKKKQIEAFEQAKAML